MKLSLHTAVPRVSACVTPGVAALITFPLWVGSNSRGRSQGDVEGQARGEHSQPRYFFD